MTSCSENSHYGSIEQKEDSWVDINWPVMTAVQIEVIGQGAVSWYDDVLQTKESRQKKKRKKSRNRPVLIDLLILL